MPANAPPTIRSAEPFIVVFDPGTVEQARRLAHRLALPSFCVTDLSSGSLAAAPRLLVDVDLADLATVELLRGAIGKPPASREWVFVVERSDSRHLSSTQANALFSTRNVLRSEAAPLLARLLSVANRSAPSRDAVAALLAAPGGASVLAAGDKLATLFSGLADGEVLSVEAVSQTGAELLRGVSDTGASAWLDTVRGHHEGTFQHCLLVAGVAAAYAARHLVGTRMAGRLTEAAMLHDIGKAAVPLHVLDKPGRLSEQELALVRRHPSAARDYLAGSKGLEPEVLDAVVHHHEALDGSGYPDALAGRQITPLTRILTVCDIYAALIERRAYKAPLAPADAIAILVDKALDGKVDYLKVRSLAEVFRMVLPATLDDVIANMQAGHA